MLKFFLLTFALSIPFWVVGAFAPFQLLPGVPVSALSFICPVTAALILIYRKNKTAEMAEFLKRAFDFNKIIRKIWYLPIILLDPFIKTLSYVVMRLSGVPIPVPHFSVITTLALFFVFFISAMCEELGWTGYIIDPLQDRWGAFRGSIILGVVWACWHIVPLLEARRSLLWIAWWSLSTITARVIIVWLCNNTGKSVFVAILFHAIMDVTWQLFPVNGSYYDPRLTGLISLVIVAVIVIIWGPRTLTRFNSDSKKNEQTINKIRGALRD